MNAYVRSSGIVQQGRQFGVTVNGKLVEGGFFNRGAAEASLDWWRRNFREETPDRCATCGADEATGCYCGVGASR